MSATIPSNKQLDDLLKPTGFDCPENLKGKTFSEATSGGGDITMVSVQVGALITTGSPARLNYSYDKSLDDKYAVWFEKEQAQINTRDLEEGRTYMYTTQYNNLTFDITIKKAVSGSNYRLEAVFKDRGSVGSGLACFLVVGMLN